MFLNSLYFLICRWACGLVAMTAPLQGVNRRFESDQAHLLFIWQL